MEDSSLCESNKEPVFKIVILGNSNVGKSSILLYYMKRMFRPDYNITIGLEFSSKRVEVEPGKEIKLQVWDTAGQEHFKSIIKAFYRNAAAIILTFSITSKESFRGINDWLDQIRLHGDETVPVFLFGNQVDREDEYEFLCKIERREVFPDEAKAFADEKRLWNYFETSAKTGEGIDEAFCAISKDIYKIHTANALHEEEDSNIELSKKPMKEEKESGCPC